MLHNAIEAKLDFEVYSEAGYVWQEEKKRWRSLEKNKSGLASVGAAVYSEHPSTEVLSASYNLKDSRGPRLWVPGLQPPFDLFQYLQAGGLVEAHNSGFEYYIWLNVCYARMGWPPLPLRQLRCSMAKARAWSLPGALNKAIKALNDNPEPESAESPVLGGVVSGPPPPIFPEVYNRHTGNAPSDAVYIGRGTKYGNPFTVEEYGRDGAVDKYESLVESSQALKASYISDLRGKNLLCSCSPLRCHGDYLIRICNPGIVPF